MRAKKSSKERSGLAAASMARAALAVLTGLAGGAAGCVQDPSETITPPPAKLAGQVVVSGGLGGATVKVDQIDEKTGEVLRHVGDATTDDDGRFSIDVGVENGLFEVEARSGTYRDIASGALIELDLPDTIKSLVRHDISDLQVNALVSPIGHLIEARTRAGRAASGDLSAAFLDATAVMDRHFGRVPWGEVVLAPLDKPATSPDASVRGAFVQAALSMLARDIAADAGAGPQDVTVYKLMQRWTEDISTGTFDGNDGDDRTPGKGLQLGYCPRVDPACVVPATGCTVGSCRRLCDLYSGTPRVLLAAAMTKVIFDDGPSGINHTGLDFPNMKSVVLDISEDAEPKLFDDTCREDLDLDPPVLRFEPSVVLDESADLVTFAADHTPQHVHVGAPSDLTVTGSCPSVTKFSYLLGLTKPAHGDEVGLGRNLIQYRLDTSDPGVGIAAGSTQYRVGRQVGASTTWILDWTPASTDNTPESNKQFLIPITSETVAGLATTEGIYDVEFKTTDLLGRPTTERRCFDLHLLAPPLELEVVPSGAPPTKDHKYSLDSLSLAPGAQFDEIAARLLNNDATGASLIDQDVFNGTAETVYLTVTVTRPAEVMVAQTFVINNALTNFMDCTVGCNNTTQPSTVLEFLSPAPVVSDHLTNLDFPVRVFEIVGGVPAIEVPCLAPCSLSGSQFKFAIPPRAPGFQPAPLFRVMTMIGQVPGLWPRDAAHEAPPPFADAAIAWIDLSTNITTTTKLTGTMYFSSMSTGCVKSMGGFCTKVATNVPYRALQSAAIKFASNPQSQYATAATATLTPGPAVATRIRSLILPIDWSTSENVLP